MPADNLASVLKDVGISKIYSTGYHRTQETAKPLAVLLNLNVQSYDPDKLEEFAEQLKTLNANVLIVGHSNTTPQLTILLSGQQVMEIADDRYGDLFVVSFKRDGSEITNDLEIKSF